MSWQVGTAYNLGLALRCSVEGRFPGPLTRTCIPDIPRVINLSSLSLALVCLLYSANLEVLKLLRELPSSSTSEFTAVRKESVPGQVLLALPHSPWGGEKLLLRLDSFFACVAHIPCSSRGEGEQRPWGAAAQGPCQ